MTFSLERRLLQGAVILACFVPLSAGGAGMIWGPSFIAPVTDLSLDSHFRYLSGLLFGIGIGFLSAVPTIERQASRVRVLTFLVVVGGLARLAALFVSGVPPLPSLMALAMELLVTPALCLWQSRIQKLSETP